MKIRFDIRDKKPKLYHLAALTVLTVIVLPGLFRGGVHLKWICTVLSLYFILSAVMLADAFRRQLEYNPYSYNTIIYSGFALFLLYAAAFWIFMTVRCIRDGASFTDRMILFYLLNSAKNYLMLTAPLLLVFSAGLFISNVSLIRYEGLRFVNILGMILACMLVGGEVLIYIGGSRLLRIPDGQMLADMVTNLFAAVYLYFECMLAGAVIAGVITAGYRADFGRDILIVLGCRLMRDGTPALLLKARLDLAKRFHDEQLQETGQESRFIVSGGQGPDEVQSEAAAMKAYLVRSGIPESSVFMEDRSTDTAENMHFSKQIMDQVCPDARPVFFTTNFHVFRAGLKARRVKMRAVGMGAPTKWYFWPNASVREFIGLLTEHKVKQGLVFIGMIVFYVLLGILAYR